MSQSAKCLHASMNLELQNAQNQNLPKHMLWEGKTEIGRTLKFTGQVTQPISELQLQ